MGVKTLAVTMGVGAVAGAVAVMMMPRSNPVRKLAYKAASSVEDAAYRVGDKISQTMDL
jgi:gas vesicle protein